MSKRDNPAHLYREIARKIVEKQRENLTQTLDTGRAPDLYWKLEQAIVDAMKYADQCGAERAQTYFESIVKEFDSDDGSSSQ